jgi:aminoglycoside phosphotransferase (APT) family kinase protein
MHEVDQIDPRAALTALGVTDDTTIQPIQGGSDAAIWRVEHAGESYALRVLRADQNIQARREIQAMDAVRAAGVPVPRVVAQAIWQDRPVLLLSWAAGRPLIEVLLEIAGDPTRLRAAGEEFGRAQAAIHRVTCPKGAEAVFPSWEAWFSLDAELSTWLVRVPRRPPTLLHLDYHPLNVLVDGGQISAVLDWANTRSGDPRADLARTLSILHLAPIPNQIDEAAQASLRWTFEAGWRQGYEEQAGPMGDLAPFCWWAGVIMELDLRPRFGQPDLPWLNDDWRDRLHRWTARWRDQCSEEEQ